MKFIFGKQVRQTERGILAVIQRSFPNASEVFFSHGDVMLCVRGEVSAWLPATVICNTTHISSQMKLPKVAA